MEKVGGLTEKGRETDGEGFDEMVRERDISEMERETGPVEKV